MVQIKNRITGLYDRKGTSKHPQWTDKPQSRGIWGTIGQAKSHVAQFVGYHPDFENLRQLMDADFIVLDDEYSQVQIIPVATYLIPKIKSDIEFYKDMKYASQKVQELIKFLEESEGK